MLSDSAAAAAPWTRLSSSRFQEPFLMVLLPDHGSKSPRELLENSKAQAMKLRVSGDFQMQPGWDNG